MCDQCDDENVEGTVPDCDKKMLSSLVVCLPFTFLNTFETKKGIIKILVYSSVITVLSNLY